MQNYEEFIQEIALTVAIAMEARFGLDRGMVETTANNTLLKLWEHNAPLRDYPYELAVAISPRYHTSFVDTKNCLKSLNFSRR